MPTSRLHVPSFWPVAVVALLVAFSAMAQSPGPPKYTSAGVVHGATFNEGPFAGNTFISIFGEDLAWSTRRATQADIRANRLPTSLAGVQVLIGPVQAYLVFVSPTQINALVSSDLTAGDYSLRVLRDSWAGPTASIGIREAAPGLFMMQQGIPVVTRPDGSLVDANNPARPGSIVIVWATGLGATIPATQPGELPRAAALLARIQDFEIWLGGRKVSSEHIFYAGVAPGFAGLYQINLLLPEDTAPLPEIRVGYPGFLSPPGQKMFVLP
ncbi:MAG: hypothetical protein MUF01_14645 [Bryobacterales bacterium]|jgi:uncharacterized protein (TIGR03437 family)|nr:hypothetical protein [Bryobacterales bacterium]